MFSFSPEFEVQGPLDVGKTVLMVKRGKVMLGKIISFTLPVDEVASFALQNIEGEFADSIVDEGLNCGEGKGDVTDSMVVGDQEEDLPAPEEKAEEKAEGNIMEKTQKMETTEEAEPSISAIENTIENIIENTIGEISTTPLISPPEAKETASTSSSYASSRVDSSLSATPDPYQTCSPYSLGIWTSVYQDGIEVSFTEAELR